MDRRPEARTFTVEALLQLVQDGKLRLPDFQRPPRWRASHVIDFFDSIYRGFPVGELLLSKQPAGEGLLSFGPVHLPGPAMEGAFFVVDGQQRLTALTGALLHPENKPRGDIHAIWFDLAEEKFQRSRLREPPAHWIPLNVAGDSFKLLKWLNDWPLRTERGDLVNRAIFLGKVLREYQIPAYVVEGASEEVLRLIFKRVNTSGVEMKEHEVFDALYGAAESQRIGSACARLAQNGFGLIEAEWFLRCLKAVEGQDPRKSYREGEEASHRPQPGAIGRTEVALQQAIGFLDEDAGIPNIRLMPYALLPLVVLARFFHLHHHPHPRTRTLLARWLWRGAISKAHADSDNPAILAHQQSIDPADESTSLKHLLEKVPRELDFPGADTPWLFQSARTKLCALALLHLRPRDPATNKVFEMEDLLAEDNDSQWSLPLISDNEHSNKSDDGKQQDVGRLFHDVSGKKQTSVAMHVLLADRKQLKLLPDAPPEVLQSHAMDAAAAEALRRGDFKAFEQHRARVLNEWLQRFFRERCAVDESDRPAIAHLLRQVEQKAASL